MVVLDDTCEKCNNICNTIHFQRNFKNWTSGNDDIDKFIKDSQRSSHDSASKALEWVPYNRFSNVSYITIDEFCEMYTAYWVDGSIRYWGYENWERKDQNMFVILKSLDESEFMNKV